MSANEEGYQQIIWTDDATYKYFEESGTMNVMVRIGDTIYTPKTSDRILDGVTRDSIIQLAQKRGINVVVGDIAVEDVVNAHRNGTLKEVWGVGTAVVTSSFEAIGYNDERLELIQRLGRLPLPVRSAGAGLRGNHPVPRLPGGNGRPGQEERRQAGVTPPPTNHQAGPTAETWHASRARRHQKQELIEAAEMPFSAVSTRTYCYG